MRNHLQLLAFSLLLLSTAQAAATNRYYRDIVARSPNGVYEVQAKSPDNKSGSGRMVFQSNFVYTCTDKTTGKTLWTRKQPMGKPVSFSVGGNPPIELPSPDEASPVGIFVSDAGWTVIRTGWDELIAVARNGRETCHIALLSGALTKEEHKRFVHQTTAGPMWSGYSLWYFLTVGDRQLFTIRPWWGRRIAIDIEKGKLATEDKAISAAIAAYERAYVLKELAKGIQRRNEWETGDGAPRLGGPPLTVAYLAGRLDIREAIPLLRKLEDATYSGNWTSGGLSMLETFDGEVDPHSYETLTMRQVAQLSLRRLGETPKPFPVHRFDVRYKDYDRNHRYVPKALSVARHLNIDKVQKGMKAEQVLDVLGGPDFVGYDTWEYDMDSVPPTSLVLKWDARKVIGIEKKTPPLWKDGLSRDEALQY
jgi:hypothetical protein